MSDQLAVDSATLSDHEISFVVRRYLGVHGGYLADFSYESHLHFYLDIDVDQNPYDRTGTTRERFTAILKESSAADQAKILRGVLTKYPEGSSDLRTPEAARRVKAMIESLSGRQGVPMPAAASANDSVQAALRDAQTLIEAGHPESAVDRVHTALHGYIRDLCTRLGIDCGDDASITAAFKALRTSLKVSADVGGNEVARALSSFAGALDAINTIRNHRSLAHPNDQLLGPAEAGFVVDSVKAIFRYLERKFDDEATSTAGRITSPKFSSN